MANSAAWANQETVPPTMAGITFLSGGQSEESATQHIQAMAEYPSQRGEIE